MLSKEFECNSLAQHEWTCAPHTGNGDQGGPTVGRLVANLRAAGYTPEQVDDVFITHDHPDHLGGLAHDGKDGIWIATAHLPFAGIGHVSANGRGYRYVPVNYLHDRY